MAGLAISSTPTATPSRPSTALFVDAYERSCVDSFIVRVRGDAFAITPDGQMPSSLIWGCSRCPRPFDWRANPDVETTDWRARRGKTAHRVRREGTAIAVSYPYPVGDLETFADAVKLTFKWPLNIRQRPSMRSLNVDKRKLATRCGYPRR